MSCLELYKNAFVAVLEAFIVAWSESLYMMSSHNWVSAKKTHDSAQNSRRQRDSKHFKGIFKGLGGLVSGMQAPQRVQSEAANTQIRTCVSMRLGSQWYMGSF
jgi:hypothetical protein